MDWQIDDGFTLDWQIGDGLTSYWIIKALNRLPAKPVVYPHGTLVPPGLDTRLSSELHCRLSYGLVID